MSAVAGTPLLLVTRPEPQASQWAHRLAGLGVEARALPLLRIEADAAFQPAVLHAWSGATEGAWDLVMFVSPNAVATFFDAAGHPAWPGGVLAGATGPGTAAALMAAGVDAAAIVQPRADAPRFDAETLWHQALADRDWTGRRVLIVRGETGRDWLAESLRTAGAQVVALAAYRQTGPDWQSGAADAPRQVLAAALEGERDARVSPWWLFSSSRAVGHLTAWIDRGDPGEAVRVRAWPVLATHPRIAETAHQSGFGDVRLVRPEPAEVAAAVCRDRSIQ